MHWSKSQKKAAITCALNLGNKIVGNNGTVWNIEKIGTSNKSRHLQHNVLKKVGDPKPRAKRNIMDNSPSNAWRVLIDESILKHVKKNKKRLSASTDSWK